MATYKYKALDITLHTDYVCPPIPLRTMDWQCYDDNYDGAPDAGYQCTGHGKTEEEAIADYWENYEGFIEELEECIQTECESCGDYRKCYLEDDFHYRCDGEDCKSLRGL